MLLLSRLFQVSLLLMNTLSTSCLADGPKRVFVSGAGGQTGQHLFRKLMSMPNDFEPLGVVRTEESKANLVQSGIPESSIVVIDVTDEKALHDLVTSSTRKFDAICICTSAKPKPSGEMNPETGRPIFTFPNGTPEEVDWLGQKHQIDAAIACGSDTQVVLCSTMGGTNPSNPLNSIGRTTNPDGSTSGGNIVMWKRKAEVYLLESGLPYTIVHPGGLIDEPGNKRELVVGVDDSQEGTESRTVPREDVAEVMLQALRFPTAFSKRSFDLRAKPEGDGTPTTDFEGLLDVLEGRNTDYDLGGIM